MAELFEAAERDESEPAAAVQTNNAAVTKALDRASRRRRKPQSGDEVDRFLAKQEALIDM